MTAHFTIRNPVHEPALEVENGPYQLSFLHTVRAIHRKTSNHRPPSKPAKLPALSEPY